MKTKMKLVAALKIWIVIYPSATLFYYLFGHQLSGTPLFIRTFFMTIVLVPWMIFVCMPVIDAVIKSILVKRRRSN